jgi:hypothetical protein
MSSAPASLPGTWWAYPDRAGAGNTRLRVPERERPIAAAFGRVASVAFGVDHGPGTPLPSTLHVRDISSGREVARTECPQGCDINVALGQDDLFYLGYTNPPAAALYALSLVDSSVRTLIENDGSRRCALVMSRSCRTLALLVVGDEWSAEIISVASGSLVLFPVDSIPFAVSDSTLFARDSVRLRAYELSTGRALWTLPNTFVVRGYVTQDGSRLVVQTGFDPTETTPHGLPLTEQEARPRLAVIDTTTGSVRTLGEWDFPGAPVLWINASSDQAAALISPSRDGVPVQPLVTTRFLDLSTGAVATERFSLAGGGP